MIKHIEVIFTKQDGTVDRLEVFGAESVEISEKRDEPDILDDTIARVPRLEELVLTIVKPLAREEDMAIYRIEQNIDPIKPDTFAATYKAVDHD